MRLAPADPPAPSLALAAAVALHAVAAAWAPAAATRLRIKWPNDLMADDAKLAGILLERAGEGVVIGFGVNLAHAPDVPDRPTAALAPLAGSAPDPAAFLHDLAAEFARRLAGWRGLGVAPLRRDWLARSYPVGTALRRAVGGSVVEGLFAGLGDGGELRLTLADGRTETIAAGEVALL